MTPWEDANKTAIAPPKMTFDAQGALLLTPHTLPIGNPFNRDSNIYDIRFGSLFTISAYKPDVKSVGI